MNDGWGPKRRNSKLADGISYECRAKFKFRENRIIKSTGANGIPEIEMWYDGACAPCNPGGTGSYGVIIKRGTEVLFEESKVVGSGPTISNNVAEYAGVIAGMEWLIGHGFEKSKILVRGDNKMSVMQMAGFWKVRSWGGLYVPFWRQAQELIKNFKSIDFKWIPREENGEADEISKRALKESGVEFRIQREDDPLTTEYKAVMRVTCL